MSKKLQPILSLLVVLALLVPSMVAFAATANNPPGNFCDGGVMWQIDETDVLPEAAPCDQEGEYHVDYDGLKLRFTHWEGEGGAYVYASGKTATIWFVPNVDYIPTTPPEGFCQGGLPWVVLWNHLLPPENPCGPGTWFVQIMGTETVTRDYVNEVQALVAGEDATLWFQPDPVMTPTNPPEGFCQGGTPWTISANNTLPEQNPCGAGDWYVQIMGDETITQDYAEVKDLVSGKDATLWFQPGLAEIKIFLPMIKK